MQQKRFGVDISLIKELTSFQLSLKERKNKVMRSSNILVFADVHYNGHHGGRVQVLASEGRISLIPSPLTHGFKLLRQELVMINNKVTFLINQGWSVALEFGRNEDKQMFIYALGDLNESSSSSSSSIESLPRET